MSGHAALRAAISCELEENLLPFWRERSIDVEHGGFLGQIANGGVWTNR